MEIVRERPTLGRNKPATAEDERADLVGVGFFGLLITAAPLAFGAVDRLVQIGLLLVFALALAIRPPRLPRLSPGLLAGAVLLIALLLAKEFAPAGLFGSAHWRTVLQTGYGVALPWSHHPEPGRAVDALLAGGVAVLWCLWVRSLAERRANRDGLMWALAIASGIVAGVCFATQGMDPKAIYGLRYTPGWTGFGPFPNRNHTAAFLAMGALTSCGCVAWAAWRLKPLASLAGGGLALLSLIALLTSQSRGGLLAFGIGLAIFTILLLIRLRDRRALAFALACCLCLAALGLAFGGKVLSRFTSEHGRESSAQRVEIWGDALAMWRDAPVLGHGVGSFASLYPLYQTVAVDDLTVLHPESSWLQWLVELGALPVAALLLIVAFFLAPGARPAFEQRSGFFLSTGAFAAAAALLAHSAIDVPSHRWATAAFGLASLVLAFPTRRGGQKAPRLIAILPLCIAGFWMLPLAIEAPAWSPLSVDRLIARSSTSGQVSIADLEASVRWFPLNSKLHQLLGSRQLITNGAASPQWAQHFNVAGRLRPTSAGLAALQAQICGQYAPAYAASYWQKAIERAGFRRFERFNQALEQTASLPMGAALWGSYAEAHPELLLTYSTHLPADQAREALDLWWQERAFATDLHAGEIATFYLLAPRWLTPEKFEKWMAAHPARAASDRLHWAKLLHGWARDDAAWAILSPHYPEPQFSTNKILVKRAQLEKTWALAPNDVVNAQALAQVRLAAGDAPGSEEVILESARRKGAPVWFRYRAAHALAARGEFSEAVALVLGTS